MRSLFRCLTFLFFSVVLKAQYPNNKSGWINYFNERINTLDPIEGVWNECRGCGDAYSYDYSSGRKISTDPYTDIIAIYKEGNVYRTYLIKGTSVAEIYYEPTSTPGVYIMNTSYRFTSDTERETIKMTNSGLIKTKETTYLDNGYIVSTLIKRAIQIQIILQMKIKVN